jgi:hypothetical protein
MHYGEAEFLDQQPRLTDFIPRRLLTLGLLFVLGAGLIAGVEAVYRELPGLITSLGIQRIAAFDLSAPPNIGCWLTTVLLQGAALLCWMIYRIRRHRLDDYRGRYRVWLWGACCWALMSIDAGCQLHDALGDLMVKLTGTKLTGDGSAWSVLIFFFLVVPVGLRLTVDMRDSFSSVLLMLVSGGLAAFAVAVHLHWVVLKLTSVELVMVQAGAPMAADLMLAMALLVHARHLIFDAEGRLPPRRVKSKAKQAEEPDESEGALPAAGGGVSAKNGKAAEPAVLRPASGITAAPTSSAVSVAKPTLAGKSVDPPHPAPSSPSGWAGKPQTPAARTAVPAVKPQASAAKPPASAAKTAALAGGTGAAPARFGTPANAPPAPVAESNQKLSKADKKALRQRLEQMRHERESRSGH